MVSDIVPLTIGVEIAGNKVSALIKAKMTMPCEKEKTYKTSADNQETLMVRMRQGENEDADKNHNLGSYNITGIPKKPKGQEKVTILLHVDVNGILKVTSTAMHDGA